MKNFKKFFTYLCIFVMLHNIGYASSYNGYDMGISTGGALNYNGEVKKTRKEAYKYSEVVFLTGRPMVFTGELTISKTASGTNSETYTYDYKLDSGGDKLTRTVQYEAAVATAGMQTTRTITQKRNQAPREQVKIGNETYTLSGAGSYNASLATINDSRPAVDYYSGNFNTQKTYTSKSGSTISVQTVGKMVGYDQSWGRAEAQEVDFVIQAVTVTQRPIPIPSPTPEYDDEGELIPPPKTKPAKTQYEKITDSWGGSGNIRISSVTSKKLIYDSNKPEEISFEGGYLQRQENVSTLTYTAMLPEFDGQGMSTDLLEEYTDAIRLENFPQQERLFFPDGRNVRGYWFERDVMEMYSLAVLPQTWNINYRDFENIINRAEFADLLARAVNLPLIATPPPAKSSKAKVTPTPFSRFIDVPDDYPFVQQVLTVDELGVMTGSGDRFSPELPMTRAQALTTFIRALGFENIAVSPVVLTDFADNDDIPSWARVSVAVAHHIGIVNGDDQNRLLPNEWLTKAEAVAFLNRLINYMRDRIVLDYRDRLQNY